ncbi:unnamed protein product, partial [Pylaiella littoralis]
TKHTRPKHRSTLIRRDRRSWAVYSEPILADGSFRPSFRMGHDEFMVLVDMLRPELERSPHMGRLRNGSLPVEYQVGNTLRWLAGGEMHDIKQGHVIAKSTAYQTAARVVKAINACKELDCRWPKNQTEFASIAEVQGPQHKRCDGQVRGSHGWAFHPHEEADLSRHPRAQLLLQRPQEGLRDELSGNDAFVFGAHC